MRRILVAAAAASVLLLAGCGSDDSPATTGAPSAATSAPTGPLPLPWDRPADQQARVKAAGLTLTPEETLAVHYHAHLDVYVDGAHVPLPAGLGINAGLNGAPPPHGSPGIAPLHTHDTSGIVHVEAPSRDRFTLGQLFEEWGVPLTATSAGGHSPVKVYVNGKRVKGDPADVTITAHAEIAVVVGSAANVHVPTSAVFPQGY